MTETRYPKSSWESEAFSAKLWLAWRSSSYCHLWQLQEGLQRDREGFWADPPQSPKPPRLLHHQGAWSLPEDKIQGELKKLRAEFESSKKEEEEAKAAKKKEEEEEEKKKRKEEEEAEAAKKKEEDEEQERRLKEEEEKKKSCVIS